MLATVPNVFDPTVERIIEFSGYNRKPTIDSGEMRDMKNLCSDDMPCLTQRMARASFTDTDDATTWANMNLQHPVAMIEKAVMSNGVSVKKLAVIDKLTVLDQVSYVFKYDGTAYPLLGLSADTQMVAINTRICFFPEKKWFNVETKEIGSLEATISAGENVAVPMTADGTYQILTFDSVLDISSIKTDDAVTISGTLTVGSATHDYVTNPVSCVLKKVEGRSVYIGDGTFLELTADGTDTATLTNVTIKREVPSLDFVMEYNNRLWGVDNSTNEIRASKQGDPTNWNYYQGTAIDSYAATQGTDGEWTGCAAYSSHLIFFKEDYMHKVYGTKPSVFQISTATCFGLEKGSSKSVQIINDTVFYKSRVGIMAYDGGAPVCISDCFGGEKFKDVVAGSDGNKYYASMVRPDGTTVMMVFDVASIVWHVEDDIRAKDFCYYKGKLLMIVNGVIKQVNAGPTEAGIEWYAEFGPFDEYMEDKKIYSKLKLRLVMATGSTITIKIKIDNGSWETVYVHTADGEFAMYVPIVPRRCNRYSIRLEGTGKTRIESLSRRFRLSTDGNDARGTT